MIYSKFKLQYIPWFLLMLGLLILFYLGLAEMIYSLFYEKTEITTSLISLFFLFMFIIILGVLKDFKYIRIITNSRKLIWFSILAPLGKEINLENYRGVMKTTEYSLSGETTSLYLIDKKWTTAGKINGQFYSNFDELMAGIDLKEVKNKNHGFVNYLKLLFSGRVKIKP